MQPSLVEYTQFPVSVPPLSAWTITRVKNALAEHEQGNFSSSAFLVEALGRSPRIVSALNTRIMTLTGLPFALHAGNGDGRRDAPAVTKIKPHWSRIASPRALGKLKYWELQLGVAFAELVWTYDEGMWLPRLKPWHPSFFQWNWSTRSYWVNTLQGYFPITPGDGHWCVFSSDDWSDMPWQRGLVRCLGLEDSIRSLAVRDWARYSEIHGIPMRKLGIPMEADPKQKAQFVSSVVNVGNEANVIAYQGKDDATSYTLDLIEAKDNSWEGFEKLIHALDSDIEIAVLGRPVTNTTGVYNPKDMSQGVRQDLTEADATDASTFLHEQVSRPWARYNLGEDALSSAPRPCYDATPKPDRKVEADTLAQLGTGFAAVNAELRLVGKEIAAEDYLARFDIPLRADTAEPPGPELTYGEEEVDPSDVGQDAKSAAKATMRGKPPSNAPAQPKRLSSASGTAPLVQGQAYADDVADAALAHSSEALSPELRAVLAAIEASTGYEDLRARLVQVVGQGDGARLRRLLAAAVAMSEAAGMWSVEQERG